MEPLTIGMAAGLIAALVSAAKRTIDAWSIDPPDPDRYAPALALALGIAGGATGVIPEAGWVGGLLAALTAAGLYSAGKATIRGASR